MSGTRRAALWMALSVLAVIAAAAALVRASGVRFGRRVATEAKEMWAGATETRPIDRGRLAALPFPVRQYFTLADSRGPELDQGALLRLLGEMVWFPTALLDERHVTWTALDDGRALATLRTGGREVSGVFEFGGDGLPAAFRAERYRDLGSGRSALTPFRGETSDYREADGMLVPHRLTAVWEVGGRPVPYARFLVERLEYDVAAPF